MIELEKNEIDGLRVKVTDLQKDVKEEAELMKEAIEEYQKTHSTKEIEGNVPHGMDVAVETKLREILGKIDCILDPAKAKGRNFDATAPQRIGDKSAPFPADAVGGSSDLQGKKNIKMTLEEAKKLFEKYHMEETELIKGPNIGTTFRMVECVWYGFKSALKLTNQLED